MDKLYVVFVCLVVFIRYVLVVCASYLLGLCTRSM